MFSVEGWQGAAKGGRTAEHARCQRYPAFVILRTKFESSPKYKKQCDISLGLWF